MTPFEKLSAAYLRWAEVQSTPPQAPTIQVDKIAAKVAAFYEKLRSVVGWTEEHLLRKTAIARILRRSILFYEKDKPLAETVLKDLVRGGYFRNGEIPEAKIPGLEAVLQKYLFLLGRILNSRLSNKRILRDWIMAIAGCEVEAYLDPPIREEALLDFTTDQFNKRFVVHDHLTARDRENLIFIAVRQALFKFDESIITYQFLKKYIHRWDELSIDTNKEALWQFGNDLARWYERIKKTFNHSYVRKFYWAAEALDTPYLILGDVLTTAVKDKELMPSGFKEPAGLEAMALAEYNTRLRLQRSKIWRAAIFSTISIFLSKILIAFLVELPIDKWSGQYSDITLLLNVVIPPTLMIIIVLLGLKRPPRSNSEKVIEQVRKIVNGAAGEYFIRLPMRRPLLLRGFVALLYGLGAATTFGLIIYWLVGLHFSLISQAIFIFFVALIAFAGARIRERSKELIVEEKPPGFLNDLFLFFAFPIIELGRWFSRQLLRIKLVEVALDLFIELPLQFFIEFLEQWRAFLKEKKQEIH